MTLGSRTMDLTWLVCYRLQPRTSKGITDLLLLNLGWLNATCPSKKLGGRRPLGGRVTS